MNAAVLAEDARRYARKLEDTGRRRGLTRDQAREDVARDVGISAATLDSLNRKRVKNPHRLKGLIVDLRAVLVAELSKEIARLTHERDLLLATGADPRSDAMAQAEAGIKQAKEALGGAVK